MPPKARNFSVERATMLHNSNFPKATARRSTGEVRGPFGNYERVYCVNCGADGGLVTKNSQFGRIFYLCEKCAETHGRLPLPEVPEGVARGRS